MNNIRILDVFIGNQCNLTCFQCDTRSDIFRTGQHDKDLENIKRGIRLASEKFYIHNYSLLGGEPLLYLNKVEEILRYIRSFDNETVIMLPSNGTLINKHLERLAYLIETYKVFFVVSDHFSAFEDKSRSNKVKANTQELVDLLNYDKVDHTEFFYTIMDWNNSTNDPLWQECLDNNTNLEESSSKDELYLKEKRGVYYRVQDEFSYHYQLKDGKPKPFNSPDPQLSYKNGCCSPFCAFLYNKTLSKCAALGTLERFLEYHNVLNDPDWQPYLSYNPLDLENCTQAEVDFFSDNKYSCIDQCAMCPHKSQSYTKTPDTVFPGSTRV